MVLIKTAFYEEKRMAEKKKEKRSKGGFLTIIGTLAMILGTLVPYRISLIEESFIDTARFLMNFQEVINAIGAGIPLEQSLIILLVTLPVVIFLISILPVLKKEFSRVRIFTLVLSLGALGLLIYLGYPLIETLFQDNLIFPVSPGPGLWIYGAGSGMAVLGGLEVI
jgi:hypothetical protein